MTKNEGNGKERRRYIYIFWTSGGVIAMSLMGEEEGQRSISGGGK
jgi:hypothetical protein